MPHGSMVVVPGMLVAAILLRIWLPNRWTARFFAVTAIGVLGLLLQQSSQSMLPGWAAVHARVATLVSSPWLAEPQHDWPPQVGQPYPDLQLIDQEGRRRSLTEFAGKVILLEPVGMPCPACIAFAGGHQRGSFQGVSPQPDLQSIDQYASRYGKIDLDRPDIVLVQVIFYGPRMTAPTAADARDWARHFGLNRDKRQVVLAAKPYLTSAETRAMIPGFQLIDKDFVLRFDSTGHSPRHDLYTQLLPSIGRLCDKAFD